MGMGPWIDIIRNRNGLCAVALGFLTQRTYPLPALPLSRAIHETETSAFACVVIPPSKDSPLVARKLSRRPIDHWTRLAGVTLGRAMHDFAARRHASNDLKRSGEGAEVVPFRIEGQMPSPVRESKRAA
jgi:hypothetical protein